MPAELRVVDPDAQTPNTQPRPAVDVVAFLGEPSDNRLERAAALGGTLAALLME